MSQINQFNQPIGFSLDNWQPIEKPAKTIMQGDYCRLEPLNIDQHSVKLFESLQVNNQGDTWTYLPYGPFQSYEKFYDWLKQYIDSEVIFYAIVDPKNNISLGLASYLNIFPKYGTIEVGHVHYSKLLQKTPIATEAMYLMMYRVFEELGYRRYEWKCDSLNKQSRSAAERLGFKFEGIFRQHWVYKNRNRDTAWYSIIDSEWPLIRKRLQQWLDRSNFNADGKQLKRLREI